MDKTWQECVCSWAKGWGSRTQLHNLFFLPLGHLWGGTGFTESLCSLCPQMILGFNWSAYSDLTSDPDWSKRLIYRPSEYLLPWMTLWFYVRLSSCEEQTCQNLLVALYWSVFHAFCFQLTFQVVQLWYAVVNELLLAVEFCVYFLYICLLDTSIDYEVNSKKTKVLHVLTLLFSLKLIVSSFTMGWCEYCRRVKCLVKPAIFDKTLKFLVKHMGENSDCESAYK